MKSTQRNNGRNSRRGGESGNAFYIILVGVILFAALMFVFSRSSRQGSGNMTSRQAEIAADGMMDYAQALERGVDRVMRQGCSETQINFVTTLNPDYPDNPDAPADKSCNVFDPNGGAITALANASFPPGVRVRPSGGSSLTDIGTWDSNSVLGHQDLVVWIGPLTEATCRKLNTMTGFTGDPPSILSGQAWEFGAENAGSIWGGSMIELGALAGRNAGCVNETEAPMNGLHLAQGYEFYTVLLAR
jgi:hypothetical protein